MQYKIGVMLHIKKGERVPKIMKRFKDQCDNCGKFDYCKGVRDKLLCEKCRTAKKELDLSESEFQKQDKSIPKGQTNIYDFI